MLGKYPKFLVYVDDGGTTSIIKHAYKNDYGMYYTNATWAPTIRHDYFELDLLTRAYVYRGGRGNVENITFAHVFKILKELIREK